MLRTGLFLSAACALAASACVGTQTGKAAVGPSARGTSASARAGGFVGRSGTHFTLAGAPFFVAGANTHYLPWGTEYEVDQALHDAAALNFNVLRTFVASIKGSLDNKTKPTIWGWPNAPDSSNMDMKGVYTVYWDAQRDSIAFNDGPNGFVKLDYVIKKAGELGLKLNVALMDFWHYSGGSQQMRAWFGSTGNLGQTGIDPPFKGGDESERYTFFFTDPRTKQAYKDLVSHVLNRKNSLTGVVYKDDPTIFAWDLMNEPEMKSVELAQRWITEMAAYVKSIDKNHLLTSGTEGFYGGQGGSDPATELAIPDIDFGTWHSYPAYHNITPGHVIDLIHEHCATAKKVGKPVLFQEFGYTSLDPDQVRVFQGWLDALHDDADCAGWLAWRLTSRMQGGSYPKDNGEHFDFHNDGTPLGKMFAAAALRQRSRPLAQ